MDVIFIYIRRPDHGSPDLTVIFLVTYKTYWRIYTCTMFCFMIDKERKQSLKAQFIS